MEKPSELVKWFFLFLQTESAMLMRIEFLVVVIALLYLLMFILDLWRRRSRSSTIKYILLILDAIADSTFLYTMGLMQSAPFKKDLFPVWAIVLINLRFSGCFISAYGIPDQENRRITEQSNVMALCGVAFLNGTRSSQFKYPIWAMSALQLVRSWYLVSAYTQALKSSLHGRNSAFLLVGKWTGHDYPVCGDQKKKRLEVKVPEYNFDPETVKAVLITLEKIRDSKGTLHSLSSPEDKDIKLIKDMCFSFSLYRLLRCTFDNLCLPSEELNKTREMMVDEIMENGDGWKQTFRIIEAELAFTNDYFYTRYPVLFFWGFPLPATLHPVAAIAITFWLGREIHRSYKPRPGETAHVIHGVNVDLIITWVFMGVVVLKEFWKMLTYLLSDWTKVTVLCWCIAQNSVCLKNWLGKKLVLLLCTPRFKIVQRWHRKIDQYEFLRSYVYDPWKWNLLFYFSLGMIPKAAAGVKVGKAIQLPEEVKPAILKSLCSMNLKQDYLNEEDIPSLKANVVGSQFQRAFKLPTCAHTILVWHIATSMCEIELAQHYNTSLTDSEVLRALKSAKSCSSSQPYIIKVQRLERALRTNYTVANSISRYCAYLITSVPDLLPDSSFVPELVLQSTIDEASKILDGCDTLQSIYRRLMREGEMPDNINTEDDAEQRKCCNLSGVSRFFSFIKGKIFQCSCSGNEAAQVEAGGNDNRTTEHHDTVINVGEDDVDQKRIITMGARLGRSLMEAIKDDVARWQLLAEVWADLLVHIAPSWNADAHKKYLATGGEFITHIWAILSHCGVKGSKLWQQQEEPEADHEANDQQSGARATGDGQDPAEQLAAPNVKDPTGDRLRARRAWTDQGEELKSSSSVRAH
ncbi:hypothetical protein ACP70R_021351 [Stipagrostis hirtigluma subsp. patula]